jgi:mannosyltransferase OCH1-like enzyme
MIPKIIHQLWIDPSSTTATPPPSVLAQAHLWRDLNREYAYRLWSLNDALALCEKHRRQDIIEAVSVARFPAMKTDILRLFILHCFGGFWVDLKLRPLKPIPELFFDFEHVITPQISPVHHDVQKDVATNFIGAHESSTILAAALQEALKNIKMRRGVSVFGVSGPSCLAVALQKQTEKDAPRNEILFLDRQDSWGNFYVNSAEDYNHNNMHWSVRQKREPMYTDGWGDEWS